MHLTAVFVVMISLLMFFIKVRCFFGCLLGWYFCVVPPQDIYYCNGQQMVDFNYFKRSQLSTKKVKITTSDSSSN